MDAICEAPPLDMPCMAHRDLVAGMEVFRKRFGREPVRVWFWCGLFFFEVGDEQQIQR